MQPQTSDQQTTRSTVQDASSSSSIPSLQYHLSGGRISGIVSANLTRANLDLWKRNLKLQLQQKTQKLKSLHSEVNSLLSGMQNSIDKVTADLQTREGRPDQLANWLMQEFNRRSVAIQNLDAEICKLAKRVKELQCKATAVAKRKGE